MESEIKEIIKEARKTHGFIEVKKINGHLYLYKATSFRVPNKKWAKKITGEYIGRITPNGLIKTKKDKEQFTSTQTPCFSHPYLTK